MKKTKFVSVLTACAMLSGMAVMLPMVPESAIVAGAAEAASGTCGENLTWVLDEGGTLTISGEGEMTDWKSPFSVPWYSHKENITDIVIEDGVTSIGEHSFYQCSALTTITIPDGVTSIGYSAFGDCDSLTTITIPDSVTSIGKDAFFNCDALTTITVSENNAFYTDIDGVLFTKDATSILVYPAGKAEDSYVIPDGVTNIGDDAFYRCSGLTTITIPDGVTSIGDRAFSGCSGLTSITIPDGVGNIAYVAFSGCSSLTSITIPDSVRWIGYSAFSDCDSLTTITVSENNAIYTDIDGVLFSKDAATILAYPAGKTEDSYVIPDGVTNIGGDAFYRCSALTTITIPDGVTSIENFAFYDCSSLTTINIPDSVTSIGAGAFSDCDSLTTITIPDSVTSIEASVFFGCSNLTTVTIPNSVTGIGDWAFGGCDSLTTITIPDSVTRIGEYAFRDCGALTAITIQNSDCEIYDSNSTISDTATIYGYADSTAQAYAEKYGRKFEVIGESPTLPLGNINGDNSIDATDAALLLSAAAAGAGGESGLTARQIKAADLDGNGSFDASDASLILMYAAYSGAGGELGITEYLAQL